MQSTSERNYWRWKQNENSEKYSQFSFSFHLCPLWCTQQKKNNNNLIIIEEKRSIDYFPGDPIYIRFLLHPNAHQFIIKTQSEHRADKPYLNIINNNGQLISEFYFEMPYNESAVLNNLYTLIIHL